MKKMFWILLSFTLIPASGAAESFTIRPPAGAKSITISADIVVNSCANVAYLLFVPDAAAHHSLSIIGTAGPMASRCESPSKLIKVRGSGTMDLDDTGTTVFTLQFEPDHISGISLKFE
jgi:hypothetical protein